MSIYIIEAVGVEPSIFKLGFSTNVLKRFDNLQSCSPVRLSLLCVFHGLGKVQEQKWHEMLKESRSHGEWFFWSKKLERLIVRGDKFVRVKGVEYQVPLPVFSRIRKYQKRPYVSAFEGGRGALGILDTLRAIESSMCERPVEELR